MTIGSLSFTVASSREIGTLPFTVAGLHDAGEAFKIPLRKNGIDQSGLYDYGYKAGKTVFNNLTAVNAVVGNEYTTFDGSGDYLLGATDNTNMGTGEFYFRIWARWHQINTYTGPIWNKGGTNVGGDYAMGLSLQPAGSVGLRFGAYNPGWGLICDIKQNSMAGWSANVWYKIELVGSISGGNRTISLKRDGVTLASATVNTSIPQYPRMVFGCGTYGASSYEDFFDGDLKDATLLIGTSAAPDEAMVLPQDLFQYNPHEVLNLPLTGHITDLSYGTAKGAPQTAHITSLLGNAYVDVDGLQLDGSGDSATVPLSADLSLGTLYCGEFYVKFNSLATSSYPLMIWNSDGTIGLVINIINTRIDFQYSASNYVYSAHTFTTGQWYKINFSRNGVSLSVSVDDVTKSLSSGVAGNPGNNTVGISIGNNFGSYYLNGSFKGLKLLKGTSVIPAADYSYAMDDIVVEQNAVTRSILYTERALNPVTGTGTVTILDPIHAATDVSFSSSGFSMALSEPTFRSAPLHDTGEILKLPLRKVGADQSGLFDYSYSVLKNSPTIPHVLTLNGDASIHADGYLALGGTNGYVSIPDSSEFDLAGEFTIEAWIYINSGDFYVFGGNPASSQNPVTKPTYGLYVNATSMWLGYTTGYATWPLSKSETAAISTGAWHHVATTRNASNNIYFWLDGAQVGGATNYSGTMSNALSYVGIGGVLNSSGFYSNGRMADFRYSKVCRYTGTFVPLARGAMTLPQGLFRYNPHEVLNLPLTGHTTDLGYGLAKASPTTDHSPSFVGNAFVNVDGVQLDGVGDYLSVPHSSDHLFGSGEFYIRIMAYLTAKPNYSALVSKAIDGNTFMALNYRTTGPYLGWFFYVCNAGVFTVSLVQGVDDQALNVWATIEVYRTGNNWYIKRDGVQIASLIGNSASIPNFTNALQIGGDTANGFYTSGKIKDVIILKGTSEAPPVNYAYAMSELAIEQNNVSRSISYANRALNPVTGACAVTVYDPIHADFYAAVTGGDFLIGGWEVLNVQPVPLRGTIPSINASDSFATDQLYKWSFYNWPRSTYTVSGGRLQIRVDGVGSSFSEIHRYFKANTGDFHVTVDWTLNSLGGSSGLVYVPYFAAIFDNGHTCVMYKSGSQLAWATYTPDYTSGTVSYTDTSGIWRFRKTSGTAYIEYWNGSSWTSIRSFGESGGVSFAYISPYVNGTVSSQLSLDINDFSTDLELMSGFNGIYNPYEVLNMPLTGHIADIGYGAKKASPQVAHVATAYNSPAVDANGLSLNGSNQYLTVPYSADFNLGLYFSVEFEFKVNSLAASEQYIFTVNDDNNGWAAAEFEVQSNGVFWAGSYIGSIRWVYTPAGTITTGTWYKVRLVRNADTLRAYLNGVEFGTPISGLGTTATLNSSGLTFIGRRGYSGTPWYFNGSIRSILVLNGTPTAPAENYRYALQDFRIARNNEEVPYTAPLRGLNPITGQFDVWIKEPLDGFFSRHGALTVYGNSNVTSGYLTLDGVGDYGVVPYNADFAMGSSDFTLEAWLRPTVDAEMYASGIYDGASAHTLRLFVYDRTGVRRFAAFFRTASGDVALWDSSTITVGAWTHVAAVRSGSSFKLYVNGIERASAVDGTTIVSVTGNLHIGAMNAAGTPSGLWTGDIADYRLVKGVALYTGTFTPPPRGTLTPVTNTVLFYPFSSNLLDYALQDGQTRTSGTALKFYVGNQVASVPTQAVTWPTDTVSYSDPFSGLYWCGRRWNSVNAAGDGGSSVLVGGKMRITSFSPGSTAIKMYNRHVFSGDFVVETVLNAITYPASTITEIAAQLFVDNTSLAFVSVLSFTKKYSSSNSTFRLVCNNGTESEEGNNFPTTGVKVKVERVSGLMKYYYDRGAGWVQCAATMNYSSDVYVGLRVGNFDWNLSPVFEFDYFNVSHVTALTVWPPDPTVAAYNSISWDWASDGLASDDESILNTALHAPSSFITLGPLVQNS